MPILKDFRQTKEITLPGLENSKIVIYGSLLAGDMIGVKTDLENQTDQAFEFLPKFIKSWNLTDEAGKDLPINKASLGLLSVENLAFIMTEVQKLGNEVKKN